MVTVDNGIAEFSFYRPLATSVFVAGDFNDWRTDQLAMVRQENGYWGLRMKVAAGDHKFRYYADGVWYTDFAAFGLEPGRAGLDSVLHVSDRKLHVAQPAKKTAARKRPAKKLVSAEVVAA